MEGYGFGEQISMKEEELLAKLLEERKNAEDSYLW